MRSLLVVSAAAVLAVLHATPALAHAELGRAEPADGEQLAVAPSGVRLDFTERLAPESRVTVVDSCRHEVDAGTSVRGTRILADVRPGQPGTWRVSYDVVSSDDGHQSAGGYSFTVLGDPHCPVQAAVAARPESPVGSGRNGLGRLALTVLATLALVGAGLAVRRGTVPTS